MLQAAGTGHDEAVYLFGILTIENNNSPVEVEEALVHVDKFITPSLSDQQSEGGFVQCVTMLSSCLEGMRSLVGGVDSFIWCKTSHNACLRGAKR
jgi:hypothetical protein